MQRVPLLINVNPRIIRQGPMVSLLSGEWEIEDNCVDTHLLVILDSQTPLPKSRFTGPRVIQVLIAEVGSERSISVYAKCQ